jgi:CRP-like cAMP-binding protein
MENLLQYIQSISPLSNESWIRLQGILVKREFMKNEVLLKEGEICNTLFYIDQGYCRSYYETDGVVKNTSFYFENEIATNISSFGSGTKSELTIIACEPLTVITIDREKLFNMAKEIAEIEILGRNCLRSFASKQEEFATLLIRYSTRERLEYLEKHHPEILQRVPLSQLSSFIGVARETLSRVRRRRTSH